MSFTFMFNSANSFLMPRSSKNKGLRVFLPTNELLKHLIESLIFYMSKGSFGLSVIQYVVQCTEYRFLIR